MYRRYCKGVGYLKKDLLLKACASEVTFFFLPDSRDQKACLELTQKCCPFVVIFFFFFWIFLFLPQSTTG